MVPHILQTDPSNMVGAGFTPSYGLQLVGNPPLGFETQGSPTWVALLASVKKDFEGDKLYKYDLCEFVLSSFLYHALFDSMVFR